MSINALTNRKKIIPVCMCDSLFLNVMASLRQIDVEHVNENFIEKIFSHCAKSKDEEVKNKNKTH